jgi:hypothetical protein
MVRDLRVCLDRHKWYVFQADFGGQILATVPAQMVPEWVSRGRLRRAVRTMNGLWSKDNCDHMSIFIVADLGGYPERVEWEDDQEGYKAYMELTEPWAERKIYPLLPTGVAAACITEPFDPPTKLAGWKVIGCVHGGMGGGCLMEDDAWFHYGVLGRGQDDVNEIRRLLGLPKLASFDLVMADDDRWHNELISAVLG